MPYPPTPLVDPTRVTKAQVLHDLGQHHFPNLKGKVCVVRHKTKGMDSVSVTDHSLLYQPKEVPAITVFKEYIRTIIAT